MKTATLFLENRAIIRVFNNYKGFIEISDNSVYSKIGLSKLWADVQVLLDTKIMFVRYDTTLNVVEFYIIP